MVKTWEMTPQILSINKLVDMECVSLLSDEAKIIQNIKLCQHQMVESVFVIHLWTDAFLLNQHFWEDCFPNNFSQGL